ncbi:ABC transporter permease [Cytobacillus praedii]|uniref:ABC transporter permease n=1 Tax=Cytobacillus praedii TaxID=1742358 RepID=UPI002E22FE25|nr:ABC transporter permease [Cytobacillus praedii]
MLSILASDFIKIRRKLIWFLIFLAPFGVVALQAVNFGLRYDYLTKVHEKDLWAGLIGEAGYLAIPALMLGLTLIASMISNIEHQTNAWKQLLALPVSKLRVFTGKFLLTALLLFVSSTFLLLGIIVLGFFLKFGTDVPLLSLLKMAYFPYLAAMPFIALQIWLSITMKNQAIPLVIGIVGTILSLMSFRFPDWMPWKWPSLTNGWNDPLYSVTFGLVCGLAIYLIGLLDFARKDVK